MSARDAGGAAPAGAARRADAEARRLAQREFSRPLVLEAGAGTGKTAVLVARLLAWCLGPGWERAATRLAAAAQPPSPDRVAADVLRRVVAITFTEAAAAELAARVGETLVSLWRGGALPSGLAAEALPCAGDARTQRAGALLATLDQLGVRTIHGFCRRLVASHPLEAGLHPRFEVDADGRLQAEVLRRVLEAGLAEAYSGPGLEAHLALAQQGFGPPELEQALADLLAAGVPPGALASDPFDPPACSALHRELRSAAEALGRVEGGRLAGVRRAPRHAAASAALAASRGRLAAGECLDRSELGALLEELRELWPQRALEALRDWARGRPPAAAAAALAGCEAELAERAGAWRRILAHALELKPERLEAARRVLAPLLAEAAGQLHAEGVVSFDGLLQHARRLLVERPGTARQIRGEIDQILVDEFQDTDRTQCAILRALALDAPPDERPGLFLVGDPKQSIYGWRNADLAAYYDFVRDVEAAGGTRHSLCVNFRSVPAILEEVERVIAPVMQAEARLQPPFEPLEPCEQLRGAPGFAAEERAAVEHWVSWEWDAEAQAPGPDTGAGAATELEARAVARDLVGLQARHGVAWHEVALLLRTGGDQDVYLAALREAGVPYVVERDRSYYRRREIIEASALVRCVLDPRDHVALLALLRSAWVGVPDAALLPLWQRDLPARVSALRGEAPDELAELRRCVAEAAASLPEGVPGLARVAGWERSLDAALEALARLRRSFAADPADVFVEHLRRLFALEPAESARHLGLHRLANLERFFRDLVAALEETAGDVSAVLARLRRAVSEAREEEEGRPKDAAENAVHVLTIHRAKGLGFRHVYLLQLHKGERRDDPVRTRASLHAGRWEFALCGAPTPGFHAVMAGAEALREAERVRTLYVAMTRARERLVLCGLRPAARPVARTHAELLARRRPEVPDLAAMLRAVAAGGATHADAAETRWVFPGLREAAGVVRAVSERAAAVPAPELVRREVEALAAARAAAAQRAARPFAGAASDAERAADGEALLLARYGAEDEAAGMAPAAGGAPGLQRELAAAVGTALHAALEELDPLAPPAACRQAAERRIELELALHVAAERLSAARARALALLDAFLRGPLFARLRRIASHVLARELPLLSPAASPSEGPVGFVSGAVDLLYRDPDSLELVVADYKTDAVADESELLARGAAYAGQGGAYVDALRGALGLERAPRFELWFLAAGRVVVVPPVA